MELARQGEIRLRGSQVPGRMVVRDNHAAGIGLQGSGKNEFGVNHGAAVAAGGHQHEAQDAMGAVKQEDFELFYEFDLLRVPGVEQDPVGILGATDPRPFGGLDLRFVEELNFSGKEMGFFISAFHNHEV